MQYFWRYTRNLAMVPILVILFTMVVAAETSMPTIGSSQGLVSMGDPAGQLAAEQMVLAQNSHHHNRCALSCRHHYREKLRRCDHYHHGRHQCSRDAERHYHHCLQQCD